ncbi:MAG: CoA pyrophosphatase [Gammaproteobacteria bacterium]|nr:CoA pyrophosphatase [Gammaproteobacteria bacterium]
MAMVLAGPPNALHMCFILRTERPGDRWSGQMALPGGWASSHSEPPIQAAIRETREEVGLLLDAHQHLGDLAARSIGSRGDGRPGLLSPHLFYIGEAMPALQPEPREVADAFWIPLAHLADPANRTTIDWYGDDSSSFPGIDYGGQVVWGLTLGIWQDFRRLLESGGD